MIKKRSSRAQEPVPRRRRIAEGEFDAGAPRSVRKEAPAEGSTTPPQYRRNQTLSSYRNDTPEASTRQRAHHLAVQRQKIGGVFLIVVIALVLLVMLLWQLIAQVHITTSTKQLSTTFDAGVYEKSVSDYLNINPAQRLRATLNEDALSAYVSSELPEVEKVSVRGWAGIAESNSSITFRTPVAGWIINNKQYYVDTHGVVFEKNYYAMPKVQIIDESGVEVENGESVVGNRVLGFLGRVVAQAEERGYTVVKAVLPQGMTREVDIYFDGLPTYVKFSIDRGAGEQTEDADRSLTYLKENGIQPQYIDVRVAGRAAYR